MQQIKISIDGLMPNLADAGCSGYDIYSNMNEDITITPGKSALIHTGVKLEIPRGYEAQIRSKSGLALKNQIFVLNSPGTIDSSYRGEISVILFNLSDKDFTVTKYMKIAQMVFTKIEIVDFMVVHKSELSKTCRGVGGFGSTGI